MAKQDDAAKKNARAKTGSARRRARELALQGLYQWRVGQSDAAAIEAHIADLDEFKRADQVLLMELLRGILSLHTQLEEQLQAHLDRKFSELSPIEASILLISAFELTQHLHTPYRVVINEGIELAKSFGGTDGHKYVNGVLDKLAANVRSAEIAAMASGKAR